MEGVLLDIAHIAKVAVDTASDKKASDVLLLDVKDVTTIADYFVICSGQTPRPLQAIADEVELRLKRDGVPANQVEGYNQADWVLLDYVDFVVHIFSEAARKFYDLERLWKSARKLTVDELRKPAARVRKAGGDSRVGTKASGPRRSAKKSATRAGSTGRRQKSSK